jgi:hypothetical protein
MIDVILVVTLELVVEDLVVEVVKLFERENY